MLGLAGLSAASVLLYGAMWVIDIGPSGEGPLTLFGRPEAVQTLVGLGEVTIATLGVALTVVAIIVELAATRYTAKVTDLFVRAPANIAALGLFALTTVMVLWTNMSLYGSRWPSTMVLVSVGMVSVSLIGLLPYFAYVFRFISPTEIVRRIHDGAAEALQGGERSVNRRRERVREHVDQLGWHGPARRGEPGQDHRGRGAPGAALARSPGDDHPARDAGLLVRHGPSP